MLYRIEEIRRGYGEIGISREGSRKWKRGVQGMRHVVDDAMYIMYGNEPGR